MIGNFDFFPLPWAFAFCIYCSDSTCLKVSPLIVMIFGSKGLSMLSLASFTEFPRFFASGSVPVGGDSTPDCGCPQGGYNCDCLSGQAFTLGVLLSIGGLGEVLQGDPLRLDLFLWLEKASLAFVHSTELL
jgi:hypothetical protein